MKEICSGDDCFKKIDIDEIVIRKDGTPHPISLKCWDCTTQEERRSLKKYKKKLRQTLKTTNK